MTGRIRNLRPFWSRRSQLASDLMVQCDELATELSQERQHSDQLASSVVEVDQLKARLAAVGSERDALRAQLLEARRSASESRRLLSMSPEQVYVNCLDMSDRLIAVQRQNEALTAEIAELRKAAAARGVRVP